MSHDTDSEFLAWFAGFTAGEGCFVLRSRGSGNRWEPRFHISLRDDDLPLLIEIQERLQMGILYRNKSRGWSNPQGRWQICRIADCMRLVEIFSVHPLRGKKQADFEVWKEAVKIVQGGASRQGGGHPTYDYHRLQYLSDRLRFVRAYRSPDESLGEEDNLEADIALQLSLPEEEEISK